MEKAKAKKKGNLHGFNLSSKYDNVPRKLLCEALKKTGVDESLIKVIELLYKDN